MQTSVIYWPLIDVAASYLQRPDVCAELEVDASSDVQEEVTDHYRVLTEKAQ